MILFVKLQLVLNKYTFTTVIGCHIMDMYVYIIKIFLETVYFEHTYLTSSHMVSGNY